MTTTSARLGLLKPDDGGPGGDDTVNVTTQISDNYDLIDVAVGILDYTGAQPTLNNYVGRLVRDTATGIVYRYNGATYDVFADTSNKTWTPTVTGTGWVYGSGSQQTGFWRWAGYKCIDFTAFINIGTGPIGGSAGVAYTFNLPNWGSGNTIGAELAIPFKVYQGAAGAQNFYGAMVVPAGSPPGANVSAFLQGSAAAVVSGTPALGNGGNFTYNGKLWLA